MNDFNEEKHSKFFLIFSPFFVQSDWAGELFYLLSFVLLKQNCVYSSDFD